MQVGSKQKILIRGIRKDHVPTMERFRVMSKSEKGLYTRGGFRCETSIMLNDWHDRVFLGQRRSCSIAYQDSPK